MWRVRVEKEIAGRGWFFEARIGALFYKFVSGGGYASKGQALRGWRSMAKKLGIKKWEVKK